MDFNALSQMNSSALVFYKNVRGNLQGLEQCTEAIAQRTEQASCSAEEVESILNRTLKLEALVNSLDAYTVELERRLSSLY